jgi:hypothetical protein
MSGLFNFIKGLFAGILGIFGRGKQTDAIAEAAPKRKKSSGYFLELEDAKSTGNSASAPAGNPTPANPASAKAPEPAAAEAQPVAAATTAQPQAEPAQKSSARKAKLAAAAEQAEPAKPTAPVAVNPVNNSLNLPQPTVTNFATEYLIPKTATPRRRPGANMSNFLDMARQVKTPG